jgi:hypothetical protein
MFYVIAHALAANAAMASMLLANHAAAVAACVLPAGLLAGTPITMPHLPMPSSALMLQP